MESKVAMTQDLPAYKDINQDRFNEVNIVFIKQQCNSDQEIIDICHDADAIITISLYQKIGKEIIKRLEKCRIIANIGTGYEGIDTDAATHQGIFVSNVADYCVHEVSEHAIALILACSRRLLDLDRLVRDGKWTIQRPEMRNGIWPRLHRLNDQTLGLLGFGAIPQTLALKARGLVSRIIAFDPYVEPGVFERSGVESVELDRLLKEADYLSIHAKQTSETKNMVGINELRKMKATAFLINTARGVLVDREALYTALTEGLIAGAGLDVVEPEPPDIDDPLLKLENVIFTGHSAHASVEAISELHSQPVEEVVRVLKGGWPVNLVNPEVKEQYLERFK